MKKIILLSFLMLLQIQLLKSQSIFIKSGRNLSNYKFSDETNITPELQKEIGHSYEFGYISDQRLQTRFSYGLSLVLEEYNASGQFINTALIWETNYANLKGLAYYRLYSNKKNSIAVKGCLGLVTLVNGREQVNGTRFNLSKEDEFKGLFLYPQLGLSYNFSIDKSISLLLDYDYGRQFSLTNSTAQKLSFINHSLSLGFSVNIN